MRKKRELPTGVGGIVREEDQTTSSLGCIICSNVYWWMFFCESQSGKGI